MRGAGPREVTGSGSVAVVFERSLPAMSSNSAGSRGAGGFGPVALDRDAADSVASATKSAAATNRRALKACLK
jgi:hypothetical protein